MSDSPERIKEFALLLEFPAEVRMVVINKMRPDSRVKFAQTSTQCAKEAKSSTNYIYSLELWGRNPREITIEVRYDASYSFGYTLKFTNEEDKNYVTQLNMRDQEMWKNELDPATSIISHAVAYFVDLLREYHNIVKCINVIGSVLTSVLADTELGINRFNRLQELWIYNALYITPFLSAVHHPLKILRCLYDDHEICGGHVEQIQRVEKKLEISSLKLNNEQFLGLSAIDFELHIGDLTVDNIFDFLKSWESDTIGRELKRCHWYLENSTFNVGQLFRRFGVTVNETGKAKAEIRNQKNGRVGVLYSERPYMNLFFHP